MRDKMRRLLLIVIAVTGLAIPVGCGTTQNFRSTRHCGSFKYGTDGQNPGPSGITATNVSCWFARAVALLGPAPGWRCKNTIGLIFVCKHGEAVVKFYGE